MGNATNLASNDSTYEIVWEFTLPEANVRRFEEAYGLVDVTLLKNAEEIGRYLTIDRRASVRHFEAFTSEFADAYALFDRELEGIAISERRIGAFVCHRPEANRNRNRDDRI